MSLTLATRSTPALTEAGPDPRARGRAMDAHPAGRARSAAGAAPAPAGGPLAPVPGPLHPPTEADVRRLARVGHPLSVSVLMSTVPAARMTASDSARLRALVRDAERRLAGEADRRAVAEVRDRLATAASRATSGATDQGVALLVSPVATHLFHLRVRPVDRVVLDPTFATRDLVRSAFEDPAFLMLVIDGRAARLIHYDQRYARPVLEHDFPMVRPPATLRDRGGVGVLDRSRREAARAFLRQVDSRLAARLAEQPLPVVLVASDRTAAEFLAVSRGRRVSAVLRSGATRLPLAELERRARAALTAHVTDRGAAALDTVHARLRQRRAVAGLDQAWAAMLQVDPEVLVVERSYAAAVRLDEAGFSLAEDSEEPGVIDDAVDELIEAVLARGGEVVMVPDGALAHRGRLVLAVRGRIRGHVA